MRRYLLSFVAAAAVLSPQAARADVLQDLLDLLLNSFAGPPTVEELWTYSTGEGETSAEIVAYDDKTDRLFITNAVSESVDVVDIETGTEIGELPLAGPPNSVAAHKGLVAVAVEGATPQDIGAVQFFDAETLSLLNTVPAGHLPDMLTFSPNGKYVLVANEGEPNDDYTIDPEGSVSIIDISRGAGGARVKHATFTPFNGRKAALIAGGVRIYGPETTIDEPDDIASVAQDLEPEYIAVNEDSDLAYVSCQEANAFAVVDIRSARVISIQPLGFKDHSLPENALDASNDDDAINITTWPVLGMYQPDAITSFDWFGKTYILSANEGDSRDWDGYSEVERVAAEDDDVDPPVPLVPLDPDAYPDEEFLKDDANLGRLNITTALGDTDGDGDFDQLYSYGARSFSVWEVSRSGRINLAFDSGDDFERITAAEFPADFNSNNDENDSFDARSDDKGPEPEAIAVGKILGGKFAFIGLERIGGVMVYDVTFPNSPQFVDYVNNRNFAGDPGDLGPECVIFIPALRSPLLKPLIVVSNEISGTTTVYSVEREFGFDFGF
jgi:2',3'-cyclic-nucleotide 2'-phosphodiesterase/3'-nucleotidase/5'-nucleotidase